MKLKTGKGLRLPILGAPSGGVSVLQEGHKEVALNLDPFDNIRFKVLVKVGELVHIGTPLAENKAIPGQLFVSPAAGTVREIRRGHKRRLIDIVIAKSEAATYEEMGPLESMSVEAVTERLMKGGCFPHIRQRPFDLIAHPEKPPRATFVKGIETLPFTPHPSLQLVGYEKIFQKGLDALRVLTQGPVHLVTDGDPIFDSCSGVEKHVAVGKHPASNPSWHIHKIAPIRAHNDIVWTLSLTDVLVIGEMVLSGRYYTRRIVGIGGPGVVQGRAQYVATEAGISVSALIAHRVRDQPLTLISGDPLTGMRVDTDDFLGFYHTAFSVIPINQKRQFFHFLRPGFGKFTATRTYATGFLPAPKKGYAFTTNQRGEERAFIDGAIYDRVMPLKVPTMQLVKAVIAEDFETAELLGLFEVAPEDFALPSYICPSKVDMMGIIKQGLHTYSKEVGH